MIEALLGVTLVLSIGVAVLIVRLNNLEEKVDRVNKGRFEEINENRRRIDGIQRDIFTIKHRESLLLSHFRLRITSELIDTPYGKLNDMRIRDLTEKELELSELKQKVQKLEKEV